MPIRSLLGRKDLYKIEVSYQYHKPESGKLIIYNTGRCRCTDVQIRIVNQQEKSFRYKLDKLSVKTAECLDYTGHTDLDDNSFSGEIARLIINVFRNEYIFVPQADQKFRLSN